MTEQVAAQVLSEARPEHVPASLVYDFDMFADPALLKNPHDRISDLLQNAPPIFWTPRHGGRWVLLSRWKALRVWF